MPYTTYFSNFTARDIRAMDLRAQGGITHNYFQGPVMFPFGSGMHYTSFTVEPSATSFAPDNDVATFIVTNAGGRVPSDLVLLLFLRPSGGHSVPGCVDPMLRQQLLAFTRVREVAPGETRRVSFAGLRDALSSSRRRLEGCGSLRLELQFDSRSDAVIVELRQG
jgi:hypothetical protein